MAEPYAELRELSTDDLVRRYDALSKNTAVGLGFYREEIARRDAAAETEKIIELTKQMRTLTWVITGLTILNVVLVALSLWFFN